MKNRLNTCIKVLPFKIGILVFFTASSFLCKSQEALEPFNFEEKVIELDKEELDAMMTSWFEYFHSNQNKGNTMNQADKRARQLVLSIDEIR